MKIALCCFWINEIDKDQPHEGVPQPLFRIRRAILAMKLEPILKKKAKERQLSKLKQNASVPQKSAEQQKPIETRDELAKISGVSHDTIANTINGEA